MDTLVLFSSNFDISLLFTCLSSNSPACMQSLNFLITFPGFVRLICCLWVVHSGVFGFGSGCCASKVSSIKYLGEVIRTLRPWWMMNRIGENHAIWMILPDSQWVDGFTNHQWALGSLGRFSNLGWRNYWTKRGNHLETRPFEWSHVKCINGEIAQLVRI